jgi:hypothetical protein
MAYNNFTLDGEEFDVDKEQGLNGFCDFLLSKSDNPFTIDSTNYAVMPVQKILGILKWMLSDD